ncbi:hypothetical protein [Xanthomonas rydalmerensis]|uniref:DUF2335 domain-containing protein n=1 Tax=Xanthomonas rydalmerensis TaxID=3046274 RepID=A0ABZ0JQU5_9XANT|nr:hypothetical protein [Xanthomonas sp. DM-2023]WOS41698.1 hypothetical protein QN243_04335 [Xanthomonas sp. DM-2023]WOS45884.1 hypothetical protein QN242_04335 [Xanthomonas sp. DM-2023]WOS50063.1 hypothetical protein QN240_04335 [Xanthomonas sp. DM-2023]WOS54242.1 hypothetical protein QN244_04335 [Xanthomonas sp. DM-2023]WOS58425.1 hypothetical protein QN245_04335 [Xanthomonas sp. DM-2023]
MTDPMPELPEETGAKPAETSVTKEDKRAWAGIARDLTSEELASPGAQKLLLDDLERLYRENSLIASLRDSLHAEKLENCRLNANLGTKKSIEIMSMAMSNVGALLVGFGPFAWDSIKLVTFVCVLLGIGLVVAGFMTQKIPK